MILRSPYTSEGTWYRGSLHIHSAFSSCGWHTIEELALAYRDYDFLAISDHDIVTTATEALGSKVIIRATEVSGDHHMLLAAANAPIEQPMDSTFSLAHYNALAKGAVQPGGVALAAHPMRQFGQVWTAQELIGSPELTGMEVLSGDGIHVDQDVGFALWDEVLSAGRHLWGFGNDDFHHWGQERRAWNMVRSGDKSPQGILNAMRAGNFYISTGFGFDDITVHESTVSFSLRADTPQFRSAYRYLTLYGKNGRVLAEKTGHFDRFDYTAAGDEGYIRAEAYMSGGYGAFTQPIYVCDA